MKNDIKGIFNNPKYVYDLHENVQIGLNYLDDFTDGKQYADIETIKQLIYYIDFYYNEIPQKCNCGLEVKKPPLGNIYKKRKLVDVHIYKYEEKTKCKCGEKLVIEVELTNNNWISVTCWEEKWQNKTSYLRHKLFNDGTLPSM